MQPACRRTSGVSISCVAPGIGLPRSLKRYLGVRDAFRSGIQLASIPVYHPGQDAEIDQLSSMRKSAETNYTIGAMIGLRSVNGPLHSLYYETKDNKSRVRTAGI